MNRVNVMATEREEMLRFLREVPAVIPENSRIAGFSRFDETVCPRPKTETGDSLHFPMGTAYLELGFAGVAEQAEGNMGDGKTPEQNATLAAVRDVYRGVCEFLLRHSAAAEELGRPEMARCLRNLSANPPQSFYEAVQAFYLAWKFRSLYRTATVGRLDRYLYPWYAADIASGKITSDDALELLCDLWRRMNESGSGDTLMNVMLGGQSPDGTDETNDLSILMVRASAAVRLSEPHINYRYHKGMREDFLREITRLQLLGQGQGTMFNDEVLIPSMIRAGVKPEHAYDYANDGCTEVICDRKSAIHLRVFDTVKCLELALWNGNPPPLPGDPVVGYWTHSAPVGKWETTLELGVESGNCADAEDFESVLQAFYRQMRVQAVRCAKALIQEYRLGDVIWASPAFVTGTFPELLESGNDCLGNGLPETCLTFFAGGLATVADSLAAIRNVVFEQRLCSMEQLLSALKADFEGYAELRQALLAAPKFGNDDDAADLLAAEIAAEIALVLQDVGKTENVRLWPSLFGHMFVQEAWYTGATPDGRRWREPIAPHFSPVPGRAVKGPTAILNSAAKTDLSPFYGNAPVYIALSRSVLPEGIAGENAVRALFDAAVEKRMVCVNLAIHDVEEMRRAQKDPASYGDLIVRVWGYSARFVDLTPEMQEHIIARTSGI